MATSLGIIVTELVSNAYLHAFSQRTDPEKTDHEGTGEIHVVLRASLGAASLSVCDNGVGFVEQAESKRHGVGLVRRLVTQVGGTLSLRLDKGTTWTIDFHARGGALVGCVKVDPPALTYATFLTSTEWPEARVRPS